MQLYYPDYRDELDQETLMNIVRNGYDDDLDEVLSEALWDGANWIVENEDEYAELRERDDCDEIANTVDLLIAQDTTDYYELFARNTGTVPVRFMIADEDHGLYRTELDDEWKLGEVFNTLPAGHGITRVELYDQLLETPSDCIMLQIYAEVDAEELLKHRDKITLDQWALVSGNPFTGGYHTSDHDTEIALPFEKLKLDDEAFGYSVNDVYGGYLFN